MAILSVGALLLAPALLSAYQHHLTADEIREAYLFGQRHDLRVAKFFDAYEKKFTYKGAPGDPRVRAIGVRPPFSAAVLRSYQGGNTYTEQQAHKDYTQRARVFEVVVWIDFPINSAARTDVADLTGPILQMFAVRVISGGRELSPQKTSVLPQYFGGGDSSTLSGTDLHFEYDVADVASAVMRIQVAGPHESAESAEFDLANLR